MTVASDEKWRPFNCFSVQGTGGSPTGQDPENGEGDQDTGSPDRPVLLGCKCPVSRGIVGQEQDLLGDLPAAFFLQNVLQLHQQRCVILRVDSLALWKIINVENAALIPKKSRRDLFQRIFALGIFWGGVSLYAATPLTVALTTGHSDITRFRP